MRKCILLLTAFCLHIAARGQTGYGYEYWFDNDRQTLQSGNMSSGNLQLEVDLGSLSESMHAIHVQVRDADGNLSSPITRYFVKSVSQTARFWFDNDYSTVQTSTDVSQPLWLDVSHLVDGFHLLHIQTGEDGYSASIPVVRPFIKIPQVIGVDYLTCLCMIDDQLHKQERVSAQGGIVDWEFDVSTLPQGFHHIFIQVVTPSGAATNTYEGYFLRETTTSEYAEMKCLYAIDGDKFYTEAGTLANGTYHFDLDVSALDDGLHRIAYMLSNGKGVTTKVQSQFFVKIPLGGNGIQQYWYWLNDNDAAPTKVVLPERQDPFVLQQLLPVESVPVRSCLFQFSVENGQPVIYAKNDFHIRFYDAAGRFTDMTRQYVDEQVSQSIGDAELLQPGRTTTSRPEANTIKWYRLTVEAGDCLGFKLNRAAALQLFSPTGQEVIAVSGAASVSRSDIYAEESGTYYLALHDVTATSGTTVTIDYEHIDRYAVLKQDIAVVGNGGPSTITFQGNGFDELQSVDLISGNTVIASEELMVEGKAKVSVKWNFNEAPLGQYKAVFHFAEGDVERDGCLTLKETVLVSLSSTVSYAKTFLVSKGNTYNYKVKNHGNMTAYDIPMQLTVYATDPQLLSWVAVDGVELTTFTPVETLIEGYVYGRRYELTRTLRPSSTEPIAVKVKTRTTGGIYVDLDGVGGPSRAVTSIDPNDIYGYQDSEGDKTLYDGMTDVWYTIEFENDPAFATAPAHDIYVSDQLDPQLFDLTTFAPTRIQIGDQEVTLTAQDRERGVVTISMLPRINAVAQVEWTFDEETGIVQWHISSLDPITMEPSTYILDGVLPVNTDGNGIGQLSFDISLRPDLPEATIIPNKAVIVFDTNDPIETPTWTNTIGNNVKRGDANGDGSISVTDIAVVVNCILQLPNNGGCSEYGADANGDGDITVTDIGVIVDKILGTSNSGNAGSRRMQQEVEPQ